jgi:DNA-damage-inducible protein D
MDQNTITKLTISFNVIAQQIPNEDTEFWYARELMVKLGYTKWQNLVKVVGKAKTACANSGVPVENHFTDVSKMVSIGSGAERETEDMMLSRYACYLVAQNSDPRKEAIAFVCTELFCSTDKKTGTHRGALTLTGTITSKTKTDRIRN